MGGGFGWVGGQGGCERRIEVFVKIQKKMCVGGGGQFGRAWAGFGVGGGQGGCQVNSSQCGGCERRIEVFEKIKKKKLLFFFFFWGGGSRIRGGGRSGWGRGVRVDVNEELEFLRKITKKSVGGGRGVFGLGGQGGCERRIEVFVKIQKKIFWGVGWGVGSGGGGSGRGGGVRVDVNEESKFFGKFKKKIGGGGSGWEGVRWGSGW